MPMPSPPADAPDAPPSWLFSARTLGGSFRIFLPSLLLARLSGLVRVLALGYLLIDVEYGLLVLALLWINPTAVVTRLGVPAGLDRYAPVYERAGQLRSFLRRVLGAGAMISIVLTALLAAGLPWLTPLAFGSGEDGMTPSYLLAVAGASLAVVALTSIYLNLCGALRGLRMYRAVAVAELAHALGFLAFAVAGVLAFGREEGGGAVIVLWAYAASLVAPTAGVGWLLLRHLDRWDAQHRLIDRPLSATMGQVLGFSGWMMAAGMLGSALLLFGPWYAMHAHGKPALGLLGFPRALMQWVALLAMAVWPLAMNSANRLWEHDLRAEAVVQLRMVLRLSGWALWLTGAAVLLAAPWLLTILPDAYRTTGPLWPWLVTMFLVLANNGLAYAYAILHKRSVVLAAAAGAGVAVHVATSLLLAGAWIDDPLLADIRISQSALLAAVAQAVVTWLLVLPGRHPGRLADWRDTLALLAPGLLLLPLLGAPGRIVLAVATGAVILLLAATTVLWNRDDRRRLAGYVRASIDTIIGRRGLG